jgi:hypothetical protein
VVALGCNGLFKMGVSSVFTVTFFFVDGMAGVTGASSAAVAADNTEPSDDAKFCGGFCCWVPRPKEDDDDDADDDMAATVDADPAVVKVFGSAGVESLSVDDDICGSPPAAATAGLPTPWLFSSDPAPGDRSCRSRG